jgi:hypothetical protein
MKLRGMCMIVASIAIVFLIAHEVHSADYSCTNCFDHVSRGGDHSCAVREDGSVTCWGDDDNGQSTPPSLADNWDFVQVSSGGFHTCAVVKCTPAPPPSLPHRQRQVLGERQPWPGITWIHRFVQPGLCRPQSHLRRDWWLHRLLGRRFLWPIQPVFAAFRPRVHSSLCRRISCVCRLRVHDAPLPPNSQREVLGRS